MLKQGCLIFAVIILSTCLTGCVGAVWTGANLVYDRHNVYKKLDDYHLLVELNNALAEKQTFKNSACALDYAVFNKDLLIAGHVPDQEYFDELLSRLSKLKGYRHLYNKVRIAQMGSNSAQDTWITTKIRSKIFADDSIDPNAFKVVTSDNVVYLMGDVRPEEAKKVVYIARNTNGVVKVVKLMNYFTYQPKSNMA
ncbi:BON domain-containing protein [Legionella waltersii]|uniref:Hemolysin, lipoprotein n=1 Tax=Legionella waltersii TaxID=66969 RepID=A0A0W1A536_9GAMM|nr:BON domain-containing protein [Legionella waltersii]KTD76476.1 hemolysin, lipoprotein [Legionella waltersii]SNV14676.1 hemolysin, lipoprotein [Legionella waltersii]